MTAQATGNQQKRTGTLRQTMEQKRGRQAWDNIQFIQMESQRRNNNKLQSEYRTRASQLNAMIQVNSLGQTLGFLKSKKEQGKDKNGKPLPPNAYDYLLYHLTQWTSDLFPVPDPGLASLDSIPQGYDGLLRWIMHEATSAEYRRATTECLAFGTWLHRFAEAELKGSEGTDTTTTKKASEQTESAANSDAIPEAPKSTGATTSSQGGAV